MPRNNAHTSPRTLRLLRALCVNSFLLVLVGCRHSNVVDPSSLTFLIESNPTNLDPRFATDSQSQKIDGLLLSSLLERDDQMNFHGDLADSWNTPDPLTYAFHLRSGVHFHDGRALTSADVKYTFESMLNPATRSPKRGAIRMVVSIETPDAATVVFHLTEPYASFLWNLSRPAVGIVPRDAGADFSRHPIGSGPFRFVSQSQDEEVIIERNPDYFRGAPQIARIRFRVVPDAVVRALELRKGSADLEMSSLSPDMIPRYLLHGEARIASGILPPNHWAYEQNVAPYALDPSRAEKILDDAGFPRKQDSVRFHLTLKTSAEEPTRLIGAVLQEQWRRVGVELELRPLELATLLSDAARGNFQLTYSRWVGANNNPDVFEFVFSSKRFPPDGANRGHYRNPRIDALVDQIRTETDREKRKALCSEVQTILADDLPYLPRWFTDVVAVHRRSLGDFSLSPTGDFDFLASIHSPDR